MKKELSNTLCQKVSLSFFLNWKKVPEFVKIIMIIFMG